MLLRQTCEPDDVPLVLDEDRLERFWSQWRTCAGLLEVALDGLEDELVRLVFDAFFEALLRDAGDFVAFVVEDADVVDELAVRGERVSQALLH